MLASEGSPESPLRLPNAVTGPLAVALLATVAAIATCVPEHGGPGITCDEGYHVATGKRLVTAVRHQGFAFFSPENIRRNFPWRAGGPPFHPPLGHFVLGVVHHLFDPAPEDPVVVSILPGRFAAALAFGTLVLVVGWWSTRRYGPAAGIAAALGLGLMPRVFAHAHFAALDMLSTLACTVALLAVLGAEQHDRPCRSIALAGVLWGLAILTRLHGVLLAPPVALWLLWRRRLHGLALLAVWGLAALLTVLIGWPWLWLAPIEHFLMFAGTATARQPLSTFYLGKAWADWQVPWHYPLVMTALSIPTAFLLLGSLGCGSALRDENLRGQHTLLAIVFVFVLGVFSWPGTPVYDGVRLFLMVFPIWAIWTGLGFQSLCRLRYWGKFPRGVRWAVAGILLASPAVPLVTYTPFWLSYYNGLVGGIRGATALGFETTYWGDSITEPLLQKASALAPGGTVALVPTLAPFQPGAVMLSSPSLMEQQTMLAGWDARRGRAPVGCAYAIVYRRRADLAAADHFERSAKVIAENTVHGVWIARLVEIPSSYRH